MSKLGIRQESGRFLAVWASRFGADTVAPAQAVLGEQAGDAQHKFANLLSVKFTGADFVFGRLILLGDAVLNLTNRYSGAKFTAKFGFDLGFLSAFKYILPQ